ncbi:HEAT repeat domain-containing protein [Streptomyces ochraceiscleroticus]|uniref:HEAT repeat domain-containing protein n=1 Tax=Streptomyces ochraceiscleroticus TaxID=47761 RepID=A0ABW1MK87_9ACTN|nr:HEAT repeat domain-containing protein [Streptomyces ochraceiscleroticus]
MREPRKTGVARLRLAGDAEGLARIAEHGDDLSAAQATALLADIGGQYARDVLLRCVERHDARLRVEEYDDKRLAPLLEAVRGLGRLGEQRAVPLLCRLLDGGTKELRYLSYRLEVAVLQALVDLGAPEGTKLLLDRLAREPESTHVRLMSEVKDPEAVMPLLAVLWNVLPGYAVEAVQALGSFRDARTAPALLYLADSTTPSPRLRRAALRALTELPGAPWATSRRYRDVSHKLRTLLHDSDGETALLAAALLTRTEDGRQTLAAVLRYPHGGHGRSVRQSYPSETACIAVCNVVRDNPGVFREAGLTRELTRLLAGTAPRTVRRAAAAALGALGGKAAVNFLVSGLADERIADAVAEAIARLPELPTQRLLALLAEAGDSDPAERRGAAVTLGIMRCADAAPQLLAALDPAGRTSLRAAAVDALGTLRHGPAAEPLGSLARDESEPRSLQARAVRALGLIAAPESLPVLLAATHSPSEAVRMRAAEALGHFPVGEAVTRLGAMAGEESTDIARAAIESLGRVGHPAIATLSALVGRAGEWPMPMQRALATALAGCPGSEAITALGRLADQPFAEDIRYIAARALGDRRDRECVAPLIRYLDTIQYYGKGIALHGLAQIPTEEAVERVIAHFEDQLPSTHSDYREAARAALTVIAASDVQ